MQQDPKNIIVEVLNIINFDDDKEVYANRFIQNCVTQALLDTIKAIPQEKKNDLKQKMVWATDQKRQNAILTEYVRPEDYIEALKKATQAAFSQLLQEVRPTLSQGQAA